MPSFRTTRRVRHSADQMFALVADVGSYPEFLPLCQGLVVRSRRGLDEGREVVVADMQVGYKAIRETFKSQITLDRAGHKILVEYLEGPFRKMENEWTFEPAEHGSAVGFFIDYEFRNRMLGMLMGSMFESAFRRFAQAFEQRADSIYGPA